MFGLGINRLGTSTSRLEGAISGLFKNGEAGVWYDPSDVEASLTWRRNLLEYTESFDNDYYTAYFQKPTFTTGQADPLGGNNALKWNASTTTGSSDGSKGGFYRGDSGGVIKPNTDYTVSVWLKATAPIVVSIGLMDGGSQNVSVTTSWQRFSVTLQKSTNPVHQARMFQLLDANNANVDIYVFGAQTEEGSTATEYQPIRTTFANAFKQAFPRHTLYQDHTGGEPVTATGQPVRAMLDKSQGVTLEVQTHSSLTGATYDSNTNTVTFARNGTYGSINYTASVGDVFRVSGTYTTNESGLLLGDNDGVSYSNITTFIEGTNDFVGIIKVRNNDTLRIYVKNYSAGTPAFSISNFKVEKILGSHATQSASTKAPVFARHPERGRVNLLKYTEEFDNGYWSKGANTTITANYSTAPNGTQSADRIVTPADAGTFCNRSIPVTAGTNYVFSLYARATSGTDNVVISSPQVNTDFALDTNWKRISVAWTAPVTTNIDISIDNGTSAMDVLIWGAQVEEANEATGYQKVVDDYDITESGYKSVYYLQFDGVNDCLKAPLDMSGTAQVSHFTGHRKIGTSNSVLIETSADSPSTNGAFRINAPHTDNRKYLFASRGTSAQDTNIERSDFEEPLTAVTGYSANITTSTQTVRINGELLTTNTNNLGSGNYANHSLNIGSRNDGATLPFNGYIYQIVIVGASTTDKEKDKAEEFVAIKTGLKSEVVGQATLDLNFGANTYTARNSNGSVL